MQIDCPATAQSRSRPRGRAVSKSASCVVPNANPVEFFLAKNYCTTRAKTSAPCVKFLSFLCLSLSLCVPLLGKDLAAYRIGDVGEADIVTPVSLDVVDAAATAALQAARATQYPAVFRSFSGTTNEVACDFLDAFATARTNFQRELSAEFHSPTLDKATIASADFGRLVTAFGVENKTFPVTDDIAAEWARGKDGQTIREKLLTMLLKTESQRIRPDVLPKCLILGETIRLVPVTAADEKLSFETVQQASSVPLTALTTVSNAQVLLRRQFPVEQQLLARALAAFLKPNCLPDAPFTQLTRGAAVYQMIVADHFDAGDAILRRGDKIDAKVLAALAALDEKLKSMPPKSPAAATITKTASAPAHPAATARPAPATATPDSPSPAVSVSGTAIRHKNVILTLAGISAAALAMACWQFFQQRKHKASEAAQAPLPFPGAADPDLTPHVAQAVREAVQQELALQRRELLLAQQSATDEIASLVRRMDELQVPMQERLHTYETRIQALEKELSLRNEENRQLLKLKIEMVTRQLETERAEALTATS